LRRVECPSLLAPLVTLSIFLPGVGVLIVPALTRVVAAFLLATVGCIVDLSYGSAQLLTVSFGLVMRVRSIGCGRFLLLLLQLAESLLKLS
jgi:hypothetical protein